MTRWTSLKALLEHLLQPWLFMALAARHIPQTVLALVSAGEAWKLLRPRAFSDALFAHFWATVARHVKGAGEANVLSLLEGRVKAGSVSETVGAPLSGVVVEVGAGNGMWVDIFARLREQGVAEEAAQETRERRPRKRALPSIQAIYGVEPNLQSAAKLEQRVAEAGLEDIYEVVPVGIESILEPGHWASKIPPGSVDCIVSILCLCSIPNPEENIRRLYTLLKPGGRWYVYEHVKATRGGLWMKIYQRIVQIPWAFLLGSCRICRSTGESLLAAGSWQEIDLAHPVDEPSYQVVPHIFGTLTK